VAHRDRQPAGGLGGPSGRSCRKRHPGPDPG
jgi:hypothetical protein